MMQHQNQAYNLLPILSIQDYLRSRTILSMQDLFARSKAVEQMNLTEDVKYETKKKRSKIRRDYKTCRSAARRAGADVEFGE